MQIFICAGEPSGDLHGANLVRALHQLNPDVQCVGFGGDHMATAGCRLLYPLGRLAVMWFARVLAHAHVFLDLLSRADRYFRHRRPDAVVLIDYPGFNWWLARRARFHGIPVFYFVPPQLWGWAGWRVRKMQRWVDHVLCALPFEEAWYRHRGVPAHYVGHPFFDELPRQRLDPDFLARQHDHSGPLIGLLPGSRTQEVERNLSCLIRAANHIHVERPDARFLVACFQPAQRAYVDAYLQKHDLPIATFTDRTPEIIQVAHACVAVSGSVSLELLYRDTPTVVVYRIGKLDLKVCRLFMTSPYISLVNMLANKELFPEYLTDRNEGLAISRHILGWLNDPEEYAQVCGELAALREQVARPGACHQAAQFLLTTLGHQQQGNIVSHPARISA
jgi:lipid-A-disaccharide synthase